MTEMPSTLSIDAARALLLHAQGIEPGPSRLATRQSVLASIRRMGQLQIDTISVVNRSPYLVLFSRSGPFETVWLEELLARGKIFEAWSHEASFLPIEDYPTAAARFAESKPWRNRYRAFLETHRERADELIELIRTNGPVRSADFEREQPKSTGWWSERKHEKLVLESLFAGGTVMIVARENFQRVYGLREMVLPAWEDHHADTLDDADDAMVAKSIEALGVATNRWIADYYRMPVARATAALKRQLERGTVVETQIEELGRAFVHASNVALARKANRGRLTPQRTVLLSPFDPVVWHRLRASELFGFDYLIECYTPAEKRVYGYFTLPILHRGQLVGRLDPKAHRANGIFEVRNLHLEPWFEPDSRFIDELAETLAGFAMWHGTPEVRITRTTPADIQESLQPHVQRCSNEGGAHVSSPV
ncbi:MAG: winged helix DNA-binding domain-containing protein [Thermomicrobiales bacterium]|nr:winged helix DNA-binding domain-containing protein [Thermomicrobiales bacterium]